ARGEGRLHRLLSADRVADHLRGRGDLRRDPRSDLPGAPRREAQRVGGAAIRVTLEQLLRAHVASDDREEADRIAMLRLALELEEPTSRDQAGSHFTASALVIDAFCERVCL